MPRKSENSPTRARKDRTRICVVAPSEPWEYFKKIWDGVESAATELSTLGVRVESFRTPNHDVGHQQNILTEMLSLVPDALAIIPSHATALDQLIDRLTARGTIVVTFNADAPCSNRCAYVGPDSRNSGAIAAEVLTKLMRGGRSVLAFPGPLHTGHLAGRYSGFLEGLRKWNPDARVVACHEGVEDLLGTATSVIEANRGASGIYVGTSRAHHVGAAIASTGSAIPCVGFDNTEAVRPYLKKNLVSAVIDQNAYQQGYLAVQRAYEGVSSPRRARKSTIIPSTVVFASNARNRTDTETLNRAFELLVQKRTSRLRSYQRLLEESNRQLLELAETDPLTGLYNRRKMEALLNDRLASCTANEPLSVLMIDVNRFKHYNDRYGHQIGDDALKLLARTLASHTRHPNACGRLGGDEFFVLLPGTDLASAADVRADIHRAVENIVIPATSENLTLSASIGCAAAPQHGSSAYELFRAADQDMYAEKQRAVQVHGAKANQSPHWVV